MIRDYSNHAANERTFLAWVRTGVAVIALGFVIERFNLFLLTIAKTFDADRTPELNLHRLSGPLGRYSGLGLIMSGVILIALALMRFLRTQRSLANDAEVEAKSVASSELFLLFATVIFVAGFSVYVAIG